MRARIAVGALLLVAVLSLVGLSARQDQRVPGPGSGVATVTGTVNIGQIPPVTQAGTWKVAVDNSPEVRVSNRPTVSVASPEFLKQGSRYAITWTDGARENVTISGLAAGGWVRADSGGRGRWLNLAAARSVEEMAAQP
jgi:hypothetical protein